MREWIAADRAETYLLRGGLLEQVHGWAATTSLPAVRPRTGLPRCQRRRTRPGGGGGSSSASSAPSWPNAASGSVVVNSSVVGLVAVLVAALAVFGTVQWRSAARRQGRRRRPAHGRRSRRPRREAALVDDPELALLLAMQSVRETVDLGFATEEAVDAVHFALHELGVQYDVDPGTPVAVRSGPQRPRRRARPAAERVDGARRSPPVDRTLTDAECEAFLSGAVPGGRRGPGGPAAARWVRTPTARPVPARGRWRVRPSRSRRAPCDDDDGFARELEAFTERTGIEVDLTPDRSPGRAETSQPATPTAARTSSPSTAGSRRGRSLVRWTSAGSSTARRCDPTSASTCSASDRRTSDGGRRAGDGAVRADPADVDLKGLVFYPKAEFEAAGYEIPTTWDELVALSRSDRGRRWHAVVLRLRVRLWPVDGRAPTSSRAWCSESGGVDTYDAWTAGDVGFTSPAVIGGRPARRRPDLRARLRSRWPGDDQPASATRPARPHAASQRASPARAEPECWLYHQANFVLQAAAAGHPDRRGHRLLHASPGRSGSADPDDRAAACSCRRWSTGPRFGPSWSSSPVRSGVRAGLATPTAASSSANRRFDIVDVR